MANEDVLIIGKIDDKALLDSIDTLVADVTEKSNKMADNFQSAMDKMTGAMKDFAVSQKVSVTLMKEAWKDMSASFDAMFKATSEATGGGKGSGKPTYDDDTVGKLRQEINELKKEREELKLNSDELREQNKMIDERTRKLKEQTTTLASLRLDKTLNMPSKDLDTATKKLRVLEILQNRYKDSTELSEKQQKRLANAIASTRREIENINSKKPKTLKDVLGMDESTVDAVAKKMRALRTVTVNPQNRQEINALGNEYQRLSRLQADLLGKGIQLTHSNNYLAQSFGYIRNRIVYALTLGAASNFLKQLYEIRGQYELLERSLGILANDMRKGSEMFNELNQMALKSPFTLVELSTGAKQLMAYNFAEEEVVETTRRLADISAALGVPMERLVYNLGQIKAQTALTARDARDFANAGLAIVPMLAKLYTEEKRFGDEIVTTSQVFDMMSKKMVSYADVMKVINSVTDEGGKFFDFQAKQADTLKVKMANLTLAYNNMLNEVGEDNQGLIELPLKGLKLLFENWRMLASVIKEVIVAYGSYRAAVLITNALNSRMFIGRILVNWRNYTTAIKSATGAMATFNAVTKMSPIGALAGVLAAVVGYMALFNDSMEDAGEYTEKFGAAGAKVINQTEALFDTLKGISKESSNYKKVMGELNSILEEYGIETVNETDSLEAINNKRRMAIALIKEETLERKHLNDVQKGRDDFQGTANEAKERFKESLKNALTGNDLLMTADDSLRKNSEAIANIIGDVIESNITLIAGKTGEEYQKGVEQIYAKIQEKMRVIGIDESTIDSQWVEKRWYGQVNIVDEYITKIKEAKEAQDDYTKAIDAAYESEKKATESGASFNDRVEQTQTQLMKAANDTESFYKKIDKLIKDYSGENIIGFLVKVKTEVPEWMTQKGLTELTRLSARFSALATQAKKSGKSSLNVGGNEYTVDQLFQRAAQYAQAAKDKQADIESRKSTTLINNASGALKEYKSALEAVAIAQNKVKRGTADATLVAEKQTEAQKAYNKAREAGVSIAELEKAKNKGKSSKKDPLGDALAKEIELIDKMRKSYKSYLKDGGDAESARIATAKLYEKTLQSTNATLSKFGLKGLPGEQLSSMDARALRDYYTQLRNLASLKGNTKGVEALENAIRSLDDEINKIDYKRITDGLNNELSKLKNDYELAVELDANPELGNMFASAIGLSEEDIEKLPHTVEQALARAQASVDKWLKAANITSPFNIMTGDVETLRTESKSGEDSELIKRIESVQKYARDLWKKNASDTMKDWDTLVERYGDIQSKLLKIYKDSVKEQVAIINQFGTNEEKNRALDISKLITVSDDTEEVKRLQQELEKVWDEVAKRNPKAIKIATAIENSRESKTSKAYWEDFKNTDLYTATFENMSYQSVRAIELIISKLEELKDKVKDDPASMKALMQQLEEARNEISKRDPFRGIMDGLELIKQGSKEAKEAQSELNAAKIEVAGNKTAVKNAQAVGDKEALAKATQKLNAAIERQKTAEVSLNTANSKTTRGIQLTKEALENLDTQLGTVSQGLGGISSLFRAAGMDDTADAIDAINTGFTVMATVISLVNASLLMLKASNPWLLAIAAALSVIVGLVTFLVGNSNKKITEQVEESERSVKRLENAYKKLQYAIDEAYGSAKYGAEEAAIANKKLQLEEVKRQLELEKSRTGKNRDEDKIEDLKGQIIDLEQEIDKASKDIVNDLMGMSSVGDAAEELVSAMIESFKDGEDYMKKFGETFDEMIDNMIMKSIVSKVIGERIEQLFEEITEMTKGRAVQEQANIDAISAQKKQNEDRLAELEKYRKYMETAGKVFSPNDYTQWVNEIEFIKRNNSELDKQMQEMQEAYTQALSIRPGDVSDIRERVDGWKDNVQEEFENWMSAFGITFGQNNGSSQLSALQQGISSINETTAGAIEAYMNGVSQQVYLHTDILSQVRDAVVGFNMDVQLGVMSQILLQLQTNYQIVESIHSMMSGWNNPAGNAVRVELI